MSLREDHEQGLSLFTESTHRPRFRESLTNERMRGKLRRQLAHFRWLDDRFVQWVPAANPYAIAAELRHRGAPGTCMVLSEDADLDGRELTLNEALHHIIGDDYGALLSCIPGRLGMYAEEAPNQEVAILHRRGSAHAIHE